MSCMKTVDWKTHIIRQRRLDINVQIPVIYSIAVITLSEVSRTADRDGCFGAARGPEGDHLYFDALRLQQTKYLSNSGGNMEKRSRITAAFAVEIDILPVLLTLLPPPTSMRNSNTPQP